MIRESDAFGTIFGTKSLTVPGTVRLTKPSLHSGCMQNLPELLLFEYIYTMVCFFLSKPTYSIFTHTFT